MKKYFPPSELIINEDGSVFHLHVKPEHLADKVTFFKTLFYSSFVKKISSCCKVRTTVNIIILTNRIP